MLDTLQVALDRDAHYALRAAAAGRRSARSSVRAALSRRGRRACTGTASAVAHRRRSASTCSLLVDHVAPRTTQRAGVPRASRASSAHVACRSRVRSGRRGARRARRAVAAGPARRQRRGDRPAAAAGDPHRRSAGQPWRHHRRARRQHAVLPAVARPRPRHRPRPAGVGLPRRCGPRASTDAGAAPRSAERRCAARSAASVARRSCSERARCRAIAARRLRRRTRARRFSDPGAAGATASRWPTSTTPPPRSGRSAVLDAVEHYETQLHANVHRGVHTLSQLATDAFEGARETRAPLPQRRLHARDHLHPRHHRGHQPGGAELGPQQPAGRRRDPDLRAGAPRQHRALADGLPRPPARGCASRRIDATGSCDFEAFAGAARASARAWSPWRMSPMRWAPCCRCSRSSRRRTARGIPVLLDGAQAVAHARGRCARAGLRLLLLLRPQALRPHRHRRALWPRGSCCDAMPPWQGGGDMIRTVSASSTAPGTTCRTSSRPARPTSAAPSASAAAMDYLEQLGHRTRSPRTNTRCSQPPPQR